MNPSADLHIHTYFSDSSASPQEVVEEAIAAGLSCVALTDHDTMEGLESAQAKARGLGLEVIAGIELSSIIQGKDVHILGYLMDTDDQVFQEVLQKIQTARQERIRQMIENLKVQGINNIIYEEVAELAKSKCIGRPHLALVLQQKGWAASHREAFDKFIGEQCPAYVPKWEMSPYDAIQLIHRAGGVAVMAHPMVTQKDELIPGFAEAGLDGLEVYYPNFPPNVLEFYARLADQYGLAATGGSDAHGKERLSTFIGKQRVPYRTVEQLKQRQKKYKKAAV